MFNYTLQALSEGKNESLTAVQQDIQFEILRFDIIYQTSYPLGFIPGPSTNDVPKHLED